MKLNEKIIRLRYEHNLSQEKLAELLGVSKQAIQKWEKGTYLPELARLIKLSKIFNVSLDSLVFDSTNRMIEDMHDNQKIEPDYSNIHKWEAYEKALDIEYIQSVEEGLDIKNYENVISAVFNMPDCREKHIMADTLFSIISSAKIVEDYEYDEPSDLETIRKSLIPFNIKAKKLSDSELKEKIQGAWVGRIAGCLLGKPIEGIRTDELIPLLKETGNYPMHRYILKSDMNDEIYKKYTFRLYGKCFADTVEYAPCDDDTNYTVLAQKIINECGKDFTPRDVGRMWLCNQPKDAYCTAERVTYMNLVNGFSASSSAAYKNPYREWIGAQIRADYYGYINPGNPHKAAEMAWRDASISHIKNGIYGAMFVAAMIACAAVSRDVLEIICGGLSEVPCHSRLYRQISKILEMYENGDSVKTVFGYIRNHYDEYSAHGWCHTISNAMIVVTGLLYGKGDFGKSICMVVENGYDTDCNGATLGSIIGIMNGISSIDEEWIKPINGKLETSIFGVGIVNITDLVANTLKHIKE